MFRENPPELSNKRYYLKMKISTVIPIYNEEEVLAISLPSILRALEKTRDLGFCRSFEMILVDDGSTDESLLSIFKFRESIKEPKSRASTRIISMLGNQGHMKAIEAGLREFVGDVVITLDADMQDPPEIIIELARIYNETKIPCIQTVRNSRKSDTFFKRKSAALYYRTIKKFSGVDVIPNAADFRLLERSQAKFIIELPEDKKVFRLMLPYFKVPTRTLEIVRQPRAAGRSKYTLRKMVILAADSFLGFSIKPLRIVLYFALLSTILFFGVAINAVIAKFVGSAVPGWTTITLASLFVYISITISLATIGEYVGRIYFQLLGRPKIRYMEKY